MRTLADAGAAEAGDDPGPAGRIFRHWSKAVARPISVAHLSRALEGAATDQIVQCLDAGGSTPVDRAAKALEAWLEETPRGETATLILADAVLAQSLSWPIPSARFWTV
ncbi:MAG: DUF1403 family protein [Pseudotabrizicola sp.]|nr:DUF1403 family protein [Pseudotabrizicola sp.]MDO9640836.1 DUF1403 family protein [Pseudotabrizicola sp.]